MNDKKVAIPMVGLTNHGGVRILVQLANFLDKNGYNVEIIYPNGCNTTKFELNSSIKLTSFGPRIKIKYLRWVFFTLFSSFKFKADYVICNFFLTFYIGLIYKKFSSKTKIIYLVQDIEYEFTQGLFKSIARCLCKYTYSHPKATVITANYYLYKKLASENKNIKFINIWIDENFKTRSMSEKAKKYDVVFFLRDDPRKRLDRFDRILPMLRERGISVACITQSKDLREKYSNKVNAIYTPSNDDELIDAIDSTKTLLLTSSQEGFSLPPLECMARGVIPVIFRCGGPETYLQDGVNGFIVESEFDAVNKLQLLLMGDNSEKTNYRRMKQECILTSKKFSMDSEFKSFIEMML